MMSQQQGIERSKATIEIKLMNHNFLKDKEEENIEKLVKESLENECIGKSRFEHKKKNEDEDEDDLECGEGTSNGAQVAQRNSKEKDNGMIEIEEEMDLEEE
ncbi:hypothetical protein Adt_05012 [Abeliophyllum distichum]|uniref:Protein TIC 214 n=1 Tax=Abeliophyllum distichum TaxID=126358 RepID=A0ABD1V2Y1_9LAMI